MSIEGEAIRKEQVERAEELAGLETLEGWEKLTSRQQRIIKSSLYAQQRMERIAKSDKPIKGGMFGEKTKTGSHIRRWFCHAAVASLEQNISESDPKSLDPELQFGGEYWRPKNKAEAIERIETIGYPCVLVAGLNPDFEVEESDDPEWWLSDQIHSCLVLGHDEHNNLMVWEKVGFLFPYRVTQLENVFGEYPPEKYYWSVRPLKGDPKIEKPTS